MSMKGTQLPAYNPSMPQDTKEKVIQESLRQIGQALMATGCKVIAQRLITKPFGASPTLNYPGDLSISFVGSAGLTQLSVRLPFTLAGGATKLKASLWLDDVEADRNISSSGQLQLMAFSIPSEGSHTLRVQVSTDAGTASIATSDAWAAIWVTETLL